MPKWHWIRPRDTVYAQFVSEIRRMSTRKRTSPVWEFFELTEVVSMTKSSRRRSASCVKGWVWRMVGELVICSTISKPSIQLHISFQEKLMPHRGKLLLVHSRRPAILHGRTQSQQWLWSSSRETCVKHPRLYSHDLSTQWVGKGTTTIIFVQYSFVKTSGYPDT